MDCIIVCYHPYKVCQNQCAQRKIITSVLDFTNPFLLSEKASNRQGEQK